jgi:hypothetical protein
MKKILVILALFLLIFTACAKKVDVMEKTAEKEAAGDSMIKEGLAPNFKIIKQTAIRNPPTIIGSVRNEGNGTGTAKITARVYYAKVVSDEKIITIENIKPEQEVDFNISVSPEAQWVSYSLTAEAVN